MIDFGANVQVQPLNYAPHGPGCSDRVIRPPKNACAVQFESIPGCGPTMLFET